MTTSPVARFGLAVLAIVLATTSLAPPAHAADDTGTISGRLTTDTGQPVEGGSIQVYTAEDEEQLGEQTYTDADGRYTVTDVPAGNVKVRVGSQGLEQWAHRKKEYDEATVFPVEAGQTVTVDERLLPTGTITGRLTDHTGRPVDSAEVSAVSDDHSGTMPYSHTDEDGRYSITVPPGTYQIRFRRSTVEQWAHQARERADAASITVAAGQTAVVDDTLAPTGSVGGRFVNQAGEPVAGVEVDLHDGDAAGGPSATTDENGEFSFDTVFAGRYTVSFKLENGAVQWAPRRIRQADATAITVAPGRDTRVDETLLPTGSIAGRFTDKAGKGIARVTVTVGVVVEDDSLDGRETVTDAKGDYRIDGVLIGDYLVAFHNPANGRSQFAHGKGKAAAADRVTVRADETTTVNDTELPGGRLVVTAKDAATGTPIRGFCAEVSGAGNRDGCTKGTDIVLDDLSPGRHEVSVSPAEGSFYLRGHLPVVVTAGTSTTAAVPLRLGGAIRTTVTDRSTGRPVANTHLGARTLTDGTLRDIEGEPSDEHGSARTQLLAPGRYTLFAQAPADGPYGHQWVGRSGGTGRQTAAATVTVTAGKVTTAPAVKLDRAGAVSGTVTTASDGKPVDDGVVSISAFSAGAGPTFYSDIDSQGRYTLSGLGPYQWPLLFDSYKQPTQWSGGTGDRFRARTVKIRAGATVRYDMALKPGAVLRGTVTLRQGSLDGGFVDAYNAATGDEVGSVWVRADGIYQMRVVGSQAVKIGYFLRDDQETEYDGWYGGADKAKARKIPVPQSGQRTVNITAG